MPLPKPNAGESEKDFISRCMGNETMVSDFSNTGQRTAVCYAQWNKKEVGEVEGKNNIGEKLLVEEDGVTEYIPYGGAQSFEELEKIETQRDTLMEIQVATSKAEGLITNVMRDNKMAIDKKPGAIQKIMDGLIKRVKRFTGGKDVVESQSINNLNYPEKILENLYIYKDGELVKYAENIEDQTTKDIITVANVSMMIKNLRPGQYNQDHIGAIAEAIDKCDGNDNQKKNLKARLNRAKELSTPTSSFWIEKSQKAGEGGRLRWYGFPSNKWRDSDIPAQIITEEAHKEFVEYLKNTNDYPVLLSWHTPGTRIGQADWAEYDHGFLIMGGLIDKNKHAEAQKLAEKCQKEAIGMSHGFVYSYSNKEQELIGKYRTWEVSHLPIPYAANKWTSIDIIHKEVEAMGFSEEKKRHLDEIHGEGFAASLEGKAADLEKDLLSAGVEFKDLDIVEPEVKEADPQTVAEIAAKAIVDGEAFKAIADGIASLQVEIKDLRETVIPGLEQKIVAVETKTQKSADDIIADAMKSRSSVFQASKNGPAPDETEKDLNAGPESPIDPGFIAAMTGVNDYTSGIPAQ